ncbi:MAG: carbohydrate-binding domain-containing protein [Clostridiales bacterium]|nr:carbohydrate-binding domain-containing protein [Clostridiales bacterium]
MDTKKTISLLLSFVLVFLLGGCSPAEEPFALPEGTVEILLSDEKITVDGQAASADPAQAVYLGQDIVYYEDGQDFTYGEGTEADAHSEEEAKEHTVVHITKPGTYAVSGTLSAGQIAVDLGEDAEEDPEAVVTLILNGADITCTVAPAIIFYNVYECSSADEETAVMDVDTSAAGANLVIADGTENTMNGSYVARIYKSVTLNDAGTEVVDSKKLHKYDAAVYSKMSMNVSGKGVLNINAENEGLDSELHLTINDGIIRIVSGNDGINTNEDYVSVTTINGGEVHIRVSGTTGEGDGIDSNGWLVINGGIVTSQACSTSGDAGIDADNGVYINGGTVIASGNMYDRVEGTQNYAVFSFAQARKGGEAYTLKNEKGKVVAEIAPENAFSYFLFSSEELETGNYTLHRGAVQLQGTGSMGMGMGGGFGGQRPDGTRPELPDGFVPDGGQMGERPDGQMGERPDGQTGEGMTPPDGPMGQRPEGGRGPGGQMGGFGGQPGESSTIFAVKEGANFFTGITEVSGN